MKNLQKDRLNGIQYELCILGGGLRGLGLAMSTIGAEEKQLSLSMTHSEDMGHLVEALGKYAERLSSDLDISLMEESK